MPGVFFKTVFPATILVGAMSAAEAAEVVVDQKDKQFSTSAVTVKVGDTVKFQNNDSVSHNLFSLSDTKTFDLGTFPNGESREVQFEQPGVVDVECAIHPTMKLKIAIEE